MQSAESLEELVVGDALWLVDGIIGELGMFWVVENPRTLCGWDRFGTEPGDTISDYFRVLVSDAKFDVYELWAPKNKDYFEDEEFRLWSTSLPTKEDDHWRRSSFIRWEVVGKYADAID